MDARLRQQEAADANFVASFRTLVEHSPDGAEREFGGAFAFTTALPIGLFNGCVVVRPAAAGELEAAIRWLETAELPFRVWIGEELADPLVAVPRRHGLIEERRRYPGMVLEPIPEPPEAPAGVSVREVVDPVGLERHRGVLAAAGADASVARRLLPDSLLSDPDVALVTAELDGRPVGTALAIRSGETSGVYNVATLASARRRGVGTAATWGALAAGRRWQSRRAVLQSTAMGQSVYEAIGFRTVVRYVEFRTPG
jgi:GNAT superfamily N-acetyltransferase